MKVALVTILSFLFFFSPAQSSVNFEGHNKIVGQCNAGRNLLAQLAYETSGSDTVYTLRMLNRYYEDEGKECSIRFSGRYGVVDQLYTTLKHLISMRNKKRKDYSTTIALSDKLVVLATSRVSGNTNVVIYLPQGSNVLSEWQIDKVFGK